MNALFFKHDLGARNDPKLLRLAMRHGMAGIGTYWCLVEMMYEQDGFIPVDDMDSLAYSLRVDVSLIQDIIEIGLFEISDGSLTNARIHTAVSKASDLSEKRKAAINARWEKSRKIQENNTFEGLEIQEKYKANTNVLQMKNTCNTEKNKRREDKDNIYSSSGACAYEGTDGTAIEVSKEEEKDFFEIFFFKNFADPWKQTERFVAYNGSRGWAGERGLVFDTPAKRANLARQWEQKGVQSEAKRFPDWFIEPWKTAYALAREENKDAAEEMLDRKVSAETRAQGEKRIRVGPVFEAWFTGNAKMLSPIFRGIRLYRW